MRVVWTIWSVSLIFAFLFFYFVASVLPSANSFGHKTARETSSTVEENGSNSTEGRDPFLSFIFLTLHTFFTRSNIIIIIFGPTVNKLSTFFLILFYVWYTQCERFLFHFIFACLIYSLFFNLFDFLLSVLFRFSLRLVIIILMLSNAHQIACWCELVCFCVHFILISGLLSHYVAHYFVHKVVL